MKGRGQWKDPDVNGRIILKPMREKQDTVI
jgi:hypothetical protein